MLKRLARWLILFLLLAGIARYTYLHQQDFKVITQLKPTYLLLIALSQLTLFFLMCWRYLLILRAFDFQIGAGPWLRVFTISRFINVFIPHMGNVYRAATLKKEFGFSIADYLKSLLLFSYLDRLLTLLLAAAVMLLFQPELRLGDTRVAPALMVAGLVWAMLPLASMLGKILRHVPFVAGLLPRINKLVENLLLALKNRAMLLRFGLSGVVTFAVALLANWLGFAALGIHLSPGNTIMFTILNIIVRIVYLTPGNVGSAEASFGWLSHQLGLEVAPAMVAAALQNAVSYVVFFAAGIIAGGGRYLRAGDGPYETEAQGDAHETP